jgi:predicted CXXCH cytochrome family protein
MLTPIEKKSLLRVLAASSCSAIITLASLTGNLNAETVAITFAPSTGTTATDINTATTLPPGNCLYSAQLASDPALKAAFIAKVTAEKYGMVEESAELIYDTNIAAGGASSTSFNEPTKSIDSLSNDCLSCHDGVMAQSFNVRIKNNPSNRVMSLEDIIGGHPVGMEYDRYASVDTKGYKSDVRFSREMVFAEGKVGCLTCHNPLNTYKGHLVMNNERSELCFACHIK